MIGTLPAKPKTWTMRRSDEVMLQVWRVVANAGARGISAADVRTRLNNIDSDLLKQMLHELRRKGHTKFTGNTRWGAWTATSILPLDQPAPAWMAELASTEPPDQPTPQQIATQAEQVLEAARNLPNSAFALGEQAACIGFGVDIDAVHMPASHKAAMAAAAPAPVPVPEPELVKPIDPVPEPEPAQALDRAPQPEPATVSLFTLAEGPLFALRSDHRLLMLRQSGDELLFSPSETRALFRYLDNLMAIGHGSLSEATS